MAGVCELINWSNPSQLAALAVLHEAMTVLSWGMGTTAFNESAVTSSGGGDLCCPHPSQTLTRWSVKCTIESLLDRHHTLTQMRTTPTHHTCKHDTYMYNTHNTHVYVYTPTRHVYTYTTYTIHAPHTHARARIQGAHSIW